jgi:hypothetical protein
MRVTATTQDRLRLKPTSEEERALLQSALPHGWYVWGSLTVLEALWLVPARRGHPTDPTVPVPPGASTTDARGFIMLTDAEARFHPGLWSYEGAVLPLCAPTPTDAPPTYVFTITRRYADPDALTRLRSARVRHARGDQPGLFEDLQKAPRVRRTYFRQPRTR